MKTVIGGSGSDTSAATLTYLTNNHQFKLADLYLIGEIEDPNALWLTNWETDLVWSPYGTFIHSAIKRGTVTMKVGLDVTDLSVEWSPKLMAFGTSLATANVYQKAALGFYRNWKVRIWRTIMPTPGDANTYGAYEVFGGRIAQAEVSQGKISFTVNSFLDCINQQVPPNTIESTNILSGYTGATPVLVDSETTLPQFLVVSPTTANNILGRCTSPSLGKIYGTNKLLGGYIVFNPGSSLAGAFSAIAQNGNFNAGGGVHFNQIITYAPFPWAPVSGDSFYISSAFPLDQAAAVAAGVFRGFPYVPAPETAT